jgi:uncharacterized membrane protein YoaK (UPF0700 family)
MKPTLPWVLSANGGYVDTAGFLALHGLFTTHVTGNFVTLGASLITGSSGAIAKLLALPLFCVVVLLTRLAAGVLSPKYATLRAILFVELLLLLGGAMLAITLGPFDSGDGWPALFTGMSLVAAMAIQNAIHRTHLAAMPPTTIMTGNTTQVMIDLADLIRGAPPETRATVRVRAVRLGKSIATFAAGCAAAALLYAKQGNGCFIIPPALGLYAWWLARPESNKNGL